ncbi:DUF883 family protein [Lacisediminimonas profundi]|uniref:DUF883 family protein n=1 Tax=Lacisediminimonas profundi TaxID=2603856 RepID=UPI00124B478E|nr:DUF883 family protein [Lacisediminimonas profundi]
MVQSQLKTVRNDFGTLLRDAQDLFREATSATGAKADDLRARGMALLDEAGGKAKELQAAAIEAGKELADSADGYVRKNPWQAVAVAAGAGLLIGVLIARK